MEVMIEFKINGTLFVRSIRSNITLLELIREELGLTGTKEACGTGDCGACTVLVDGKAVNSCIFLAADADGKEITTVEGLEQDGKLDPLQEEFVKHGAIQCGYCTPGMLMSAKALLKDYPQPTEEQIRYGMAGNLCRCTGYDNIIKAVKATAERLNSKDM